MIDYATTTHALYQNLHYIKQPQDCTQEILWIKGVRSTHTIKFIIMFCEGKRPAKLHCFLSFTLRGNDITYIAKSNKCENKILYFVPLVKTSIISKFSLHYMESRHVRQRQRSWPCQTNEWNKVIIKKICSYWRVQKKKIKSFFMFSKVLSSCHLKKQIAHCLATLEYTIP